MRFAWILVILCSGPIAHGQETSEPSSAPVGAAPDGTESEARDDRPETTAEPPLERHPKLLQMLFRNNQLRRSRGLWAHRMHPALARAAQDHANYMAQTRDFNHYSNRGPSGRAHKYGFPSGVLENIAMGYGDVNTAFYGWQTSGGHWSNMTSQTTDAGFGYAISRDGTPYWVAVYGNAPAAAPPVAQPAVQQAIAVVPVDPAASSNAVSTASSSTPGESAPGDATASAESTAGGSTAATPSVAAAPVASAPAVASPTRTSAPRVYSAGSSGGRVRWLRRRR